MTSPKLQIRQLNDALRQHHKGGNVLLTAGISSLPAATIQAIDEAITAFDRFDDANDPYGEHDFGSVEIHGHRVFFKIDYYDHSFRHHSPNPADPTVTKRVMTIMLANEY